MDDSLPFRLTSRHPLDLLQPTAYRKERLADSHHFECKCKSCTSEIPPFKLSEAVNIDALIRRLLDLFENSQGEDPKKYSLTVTKTELFEYENSAIKYLRSNNKSHTTKETLQIQFLLAQIWNTLRR